MSKVEITEEQKKILLGALGSSEYTAEEFLEKFFEVSDADGLEHWLDEDGLLPGAS